MLQGTPQAPQEKPSLGSINMMQSDHVAYNRTGDEVVNQVHCTNPLMCIIVPVPLHNPQKSFY